MEEEEEEEEEQYVNRLVLLLLLFQLHVFFDLHGMGGNRMFLKEMTEMGERDQWVTGRVDASHKIDDDGIVRSCGDRGKNPALMSRKDENKKNGRRKKML